jgi:RND superfamily putative drug exporter
MCFRHRYVVLAVWILALVGLAAIGSAAPAKYDNTFSVPGSDSAAALALLQEGFPARSGEQDTIVWHASQGTVRDPEVRRAMSAALARIATLPEVAAVSSPYVTGGATQVSTDGRTAYAPVTFTDQANNLDANHVNAVLSTAQGAGSGTLEVEMTGQATDTANQPRLSTTVIVGLLAAAVVLFIAFGSLLAMVLPLLTAIFGLGSGLMLMGLLTHAFSIAVLAPSLSVLIGLGVGIDYALFIVTRHRRGLARGLSTEDAAVAALDTAGRAVLFAGATVCIALLGMLVLGVSYLNGVAVASALVILLTVASAVTLLPAMFGVLGLRVLSRRQRRKLVQHGPETVAATGGFWSRWAGFVQRHPRPLALAGAAVMIVLSLPIGSMRLGRADDGTLPSDMTSRRGYDLLAEGFGPGFNGPLQLVAQVGSDGDRAALAKLTDAVRGAPGVAGIAVTPVAPAATVRIIQVYPESAPDTAATSDLVRRLRTTLVPAAASGTTLAVHIGGATAVFDDFGEMLNGALPLFIGVIIGLGCLLLLLAFRSLAVPVTAAVMNLLGAGASFGVVVAIFQWGWGLNAMGLGTTGPVEAFMPVLMLAILFGLSMDYQVFLLSRTHEEWVHTGDNRRAVHAGLAETGRVITAAAGIMICVFMAFVLGGQRAISEFGLGLVAAVALDAFVVRSVLAPAVMQLLGRANWWLPAGLDRRLPHLSVERADEPVPAPQTQVEPVAAASR